MTTKKTEEAEDTSVPAELKTTTESVTLPETTTASDVTVPVKADLEKVSTATPDLLGAPDTAPKLVNNDNGTVSFSDSQVVKVTHPEFVQGAVEMDNADVTKSVRIENIETPMVTREFRITDERLKKADFQRIMEDMKKTRPSVYAEREADLIKQRDAAPE